MSGAQEASLVAELQEREAAGDGFLGLGGVDLDVNVSGGRFNDVDSLRWQRGFLGGRVGLRGRGRAGAACLLQNGDDGLLGGDERGDDGDAVGGGDKGEELVG